MILHVTEQGLSLGQPEILKSFSIQIDDSRLSKVKLIDLHPELRSEAQGQRVAVKLETLHRLAGDLAHDEEWRSGFDSMVKYARTKGWMTEEGEVIGHVV